MPGAEGQDRSMSAYDPRTATGIPTEPVGSLPRPTSLQNAYAAYDAGDVAYDQLGAEQDAAVRDSIGRLEATGAPSSPTASSADQASPPMASPTP
jgi:hypothetical protein